MVKKCIYCSAEIDDDYVIDFCEKCGKNVFGVKMFETIIQNMENARAKGDLCHSNFVEETPKNLQSFGRANEDFSL